MCNLCAAQSDSAQLAAFDNHIQGEIVEFSTAAAAAGSDSALIGRASEIYSYSRIADYLTHGYWEYRNQTARAFELDSSRTLTYDISRLSAETRQIAERAFDVWSTATGITFKSVGANANLFTEVQDAGATIRTAVAVNSNSVISGKLSVKGDVDFYKVDLVKGQTYFMTLTGAKDAGIDAVLKLMGADGRLLESEDSTGATDGTESISFTAKVSGAHYLVASAASRASTGGYELSIQRSADITFSEADTGATAWTEREGEVVKRGYVNIDDTFAARHMNGYMLQTYMHEIGHVLGLGHAGPYNGMAIWMLNGSYLNDSWSSSIMSYFTQSEAFGLNANPNDKASHAWMQTLMPADLIAAHKLYGAGSKGAETGDTVWGPGGNLQDAHLQKLLNIWAKVETADRFVYSGNNFAFMVYDTDGVDTFDFSGFKSHQRIYLTETERSNIGGLTGNMVIAPGTVIENAVSGSGNDRLTGNDVSNMLISGAGNDLIYGGKGDDFLFGGVGNDRIYGGEGNDVLFGGEGSDVLYGDDGDDLLIGAANVDLSTYAVALSLAAANAVTQAAAYGNDGILF